LLTKKSVAAPEEVQFMNKYAGGAYSLRKQLIASSVLEREDKCYRITQDYSFSSPSTAAGS
jgi:hypothetical protein